MMTDLDGNNSTVVGIGDFTNIHITKNYTYYYEITVGDDKDLYYIETGETPEPKKFD